ncbi:FGGY carbohydrate kinase domain-containing protein-like [Triticum dicoccoides]|uniref:FGGY carbohydrate kinase domain-containing protein-like n=1 Tax=Triticum dicoccoides TaxID=85692 RepID=UPI00188EC280|nr:FGGY carbohydrate kinase domain-containing protein-like [Triticum dicoccoides]
MLYRETGDETRSLSHMEQQRELKPCGMEPCGRGEVFWAESLGDLYEESYAKTGHSIVFPRHPLCSGLTPTSAKELGLLPGTPVGTSLMMLMPGVLESWKVCQMQSLKLKR